MLCRPLSVPVRWALGEQVVVVAAAPLTPALVGVVGGLVRQNLEILGQRDLAPIVGGGDLGVKVVGSMWHARSVTSPRDPSRSNQDRHNFPEIVASRGTGGDNFREVVPILHDPWRLVASDL